MTFHFLLSTFHVYFEKLWSFYNNIAHSLLLRTIRPLV